jgi:hypothetical protein
LTSIGALFPLAGPAPVPADETLLRDLGVTAVRVTVPWSRLQPRPGRLDPSAAEDAASLVGATSLPTWVCLFEGAAPGWFLDDGGFADEKTAARWWPRFADQMADLVGDRIAGWVPIDNPVGYALATRPDEGEPQARLHRNLLTAWRDAWLVLRGGPPVATALGLEPVPAPADDVPAQQRARRLDHLRWRTWPRALRDGTAVVPGLPDVEIAELAGAGDVLGGWFRSPPAVEPERWHDDLAGMVRRLADEGPAWPLHVTLSLAAEEPARRRGLVEASTAAIDDAVDDGVPVEHVWVRPAMGPAATGSLLLATDDPNESATAWSS